MGNRPKIGLALGGGAARGIANIGVLKAFENAGIKIDFLAGTSSGSIIAVLYAYLMDISLLEKIALNLNWKDFSEITISKRGLASSSKIEKFINHHCSNAKFSDLKIPVYISSCNLLDGEEIVFNEGRIAPAVRASCSIPGIFTPYEKDNKLLVDGGLISTVPIKLTRELGSDIVIAVDVNAKANMFEDLSNIAQIIFQSLYTIQRQNVKNFYKYADFVIMPEVGALGMTELKEAKLLIDKGFEAAEQIIPFLKKKIRKKSGFWSNIWK